MRKRKYEFYVEPSDDFTNYVIAVALPGEDMVGKMKDTDGKPHPVWGCNAAFVTRLGRSRLSPLRFKVFSQEDGRGPLRECTFLFLKKRKKTEAIKLEK